MAARKHRMTVATATAHTNTSVSALHMPGRGMSNSMATAMSAVTSTSIHRRRYCQETYHHKRSKC